MLYFFFAGFDGWWVKDYGDGFVTGVYLVEIDKGLAAWFVLVVMACLICET